MPSCIDVRVDHNPGGHSKRTNQELLLVFNFKKV